MIVAYDMGAQELAVIRAPFFDEPDIVLAGADDGMLLFAAVRESVLSLWSMEAACPNANGAATWARRRVIELQPLLPLCAFFHVLVVGFAEGAGVIFLGTGAGLYTVELSSGRSKKVGQRFFGKAIPYTSFYTGGHGDRGRRAVFGATRRWAGLLWLYGENLQ